MPDEAKAEMTRLHTIFEKVLAKHSGEVILEHTLLPLIHTELIMELGEGWTAKVYLSTEPRSWTRPTLTVVLTKDGDVEPYVFTKLL